MGFALTCLPRPGKTCLMFLFLFYVLILFHVLFYIHNGSDMGLLVLARTWGRRALAAGVQHGPPAPPKQSQGARFHLGCACPATPTRCPERKRNRGHETRNCLFRSRYEYMGTEAS